MTNQYPEVTFQAGSAYIGVPRVAAHSGSMAVSSAVVASASLVRPSASDFAGHQIVMDFTSPVSAVGLFVGREAPTRYTYEAVVAVLIGYGQDASANPVTLASSFIELPGSPTNIDRCLSITAPEGTIIHTAVLDFLDSSGTSTFDSRWMDDLTFLPATTSIKDTPPTVIITRPMNASIVTPDTVILHADITEDIRLDSVVIMVNSNPAITVPAGDIRRDAENPMQYRLSTALPTSQLLPNHSNDVLVTATDSAGQSTGAAVQFTYQPASAVNIFVFDGRVEVTQAIQCLDHDDYYLGVCPDNSVGIIPGRPTLVRVYPGESGPAWVAGVSGAICPGVTGEAGCANPLRPFSPITINGFRAIWNLRDDLDQTLNFLIPGDWLRVGRMQFTVYVNYNEENYPERDYTDNFTTVTATVVPGKTLDVIFIPVNANGYSPDYSLRYPIADGLFAVFPVSQVRLWRNSVYNSITDNYNFGQHSGWEDLLSDLMGLRSHHDNSAVPYLRYFGMVPLTANPARATFGMGYRGGYVSSGEVSADILGSQMTAAEEIGHNHGRQHASGAGGAENPDPGYPGSSGFLDDTGVNVRTRQVFPRASSYDYMSYHGSQEEWTSVYTYKSMYAAINSVTSFNQANPFRGIGVAEVPLQAEVTRYLVGRGWIAPDSVGLDSAFFQIERVSPLWDNLPAGPYTMELQDPQGNVLFTRGFNVPLNDDNPSDAGFFNFAVPWVDGTSMVVFKYNGAEMVRRMASPNSPMVTILSPNGGEAWGESGLQLITWNGSDPDGEVLTYLVQYTCDKGNTWSPLTSGTQDTGLTVDAAELPGGEACLVRVIASDGLNTAVDTSDGFFTVARKAPGVYIANPQDTAQLTPGYPVILTAYGDDLEDGTLSTETFQWSSDRDGSLGGGNMLIASTQTLSAGEHAITLTGTDKDGMTATYTTRINLVPPPDAAVTETVEIENTGPSTLLIKALVAAGAVILLLVVVVVLLLVRGKKKN